MFANHNRNVRELLLASGAVDEVFLNAVQEACEENGESVAESVVIAGLLTRPALLQAVASYLEYLYVDTPPSRIDPQLAARIPARLAQRYGIVPLDHAGDRLQVLAVDPFNPHIASDLAFSLRCEVEIAVCDPEAVVALIEACYGGFEGESLEEILAGTDPLDLDESRDFTVSELSEYASDVPVIRFTDAILSRAIRDRASDIHFEPYEDLFRVRYRIDGVLHEIPAPPRSWAIPVTSRLKVLADLDIAERRLPQDGRIRTSIAGRPVDMRVSTLPTQFGESVVLRVLDKSIVTLDLDRLRMPSDILSRVRAIAHRPNGIFIVTGPTGSGKTTTLYSVLREVNQEHTKILTAEDPVEYEIDGLVQTAINPAAGLTFATALRAFLRQDPDKLLVGEIRDAETARIAAQAALTGHFVFTTLHTNDAVGAIDRLVDMDLEPYLIAATVEAVLAQRLVRRICPRCRTASEPASGMLALLDLTLDDLDGGQWAVGRGCPHCHGTGYSGRIGLFELVTVTDDLRELIASGASAAELRATAEGQGMRPLREAGIDALLRGESTADEVLRYT